MGDFELAERRFPVNLLMDQWRSFGKSLYIDAQEELKVFDLINGNTILYYSLTRILYIKSMNSLAKFVYEIRRLGKGSVNNTGWKGEGGECRFLNQRSRSQTWIEYAHDKRLKYTSDVNPPVDGISQSCHALTRKICSISEPFDGAKQFLYFTYLPVRWGRGRSARAKRSSNFIEYPRASSTDLISPLEYIEESWKIPVLPRRKGSPFSRKIIRYGGDESWNFRNKIGEISLRFRFGNVQRPKDMISTSSKGKLGDVSGYTFDTISLDQSCTSRFFTRVSPSMYEGKK